MSNHPPTPFEESHQALDLESEHVVADVLSSPQEIFNWRSFGVGCFHFTHKMPSKLGEPAVSTSDYYRKLEDSLGSVTNITEIEISRSATFQEYINNEWKFGEHPPMSHGYGIYPWPTSGYVQFKLFLPRRVQEELIGEFRVPSNTELFLVRIIYGSKMPVAFVRAMDGYVEDPSSMVTIVWRYLKKTLGSNDSNLRFDLIGPSPFHVDFYLSSYAGEKYDVEYKENRGYDTVRIKVPLRDEVEQVWENVELRVQRELQEFYSIVRARNSINRNLVDILSEADLIIEDQLVGLKFRNALRSFGFRKRVLALALRSERIDLEITSLTRILQETIKDIERDWRFCIIGTKLSRELKDLDQLPLPSYKRMLSALDGSSTVSSINQTAVIAAMVGAIVSVTMTLGVQSWFSDHATRAPQIQQTPADEKIGQPPIQ